MQSDLKAVGFDLQREVLEPGAYNEQYGPKTYDVTDWGFSGVDADLLRSHLATDGFQNASQVSDPALDALLEQGASTTDPAARNAIYAQVQQWNADQPPSCRCTAGPDQRRDPEGLGSDVRPVRPSALRDRYGRLSRRVSDTLFGCHVLARAYLLTRLGGIVASVVLVLWGAATLAFVAFRIIPGDPVDVLLGPQAQVSEAVKAGIRSDLGLDRPVLEQYATFLGGSCAATSVSRTSCANRSSRSSGASSPRLCSSPRSRW